MHPPPIKSARWEEPETYEEYWGVEANPTVLTPITEAGSSASGGGAASSPDHNTSEDELMEGRGEEEQGGEEDGQMFYSPLPAAEGSHEQGEEPVQASLEVANALLEALLSKLGSRQPEVKIQGATEAKYWQATLGSRVEPTVAWTGWACAAEVLMASWDPGVAAMRWPLLSADVRGILVRGGYPRQEVETVMARSEPPKDLLDEEDIPEHEDPRAISSLQIEGVLHAWYGGRTLSGWSCWTSHHHPSFA